jgi:hypothetical protein
VLYQSDPNPYTITGFLRMLEIHIFNFFLTSYNPFMQEIMAGRQLNTVLQNQIKHYVQLKPGMIIKTGCKMDAFSRKYFDEEVMKILSAAAFQHTCILISNMKLEKPEVPLLSEDC